MEFIDSAGKLVEKDLFTNREPSHFAVAKLLATGLVNLNRVEVLWRPVTNHLLEVIIHPLNHMREWGIEAITTKLSLKYSTKPCEIVLQYDDENNKQNPDSLTLSVIILDMVFKLMQEFKNSYSELIAKVESDVAKHPDKIDLLLDALKDINYLLRALGPYGAYLGSKPREHCSSLLAEEFRLLPEIRLLRGDEQQTIHKQ
ncbi:hypothetical protein OUZ56_016547 [Daphnia magna]|uniref:Uncharacterized protein n=1 Tax=Daphnia magna TaxID=35525 RepID=A0ABR0AQW0_9CRUS|nr:hypothetical protein OUZ56_016547 [Daphnia magna]